MLKLRIYYQQLVSFASFQMVESTQDYTIPFQYKKVFTPEECTELVQNFKNYDANKDGHICLKEFTKILKDMGRSDITAEMQEDVFKKYDRNTNDVIEYLEFLDMFVCFKTEASTFGKTEGQSMAKIDGAVGSQHSYHEEELNVVTRLFNTMLEGDEFVSERLPMKDTDLFHAMSDGMMLIRLLNLMEKDCVDMRTVNKGKNLNIYKVRENLNLALTSAKGKIKLIGIDASAFLEKKPHLVLGVSWQIARQLSIKNITLAECPEIYRLLKEGEELSSLLKLPAEEILIRWINFHLKEAGQTKFVSNLGKDLKDSNALSYVLNQLDKQKCPLNHLGETDDLKRAQTLINNSDALGVPHVMDAEDFIKANTKSNTIYVAEIFNTKHGLQELTKEEEKAFEAAGLTDDDTVEGSREERSFRLWINSLDIEGVFINNLYEECRTGDLLLKVIHKIDPTVVEWNRVEKNANNVFKQGINCQVAFDACKKMKIHLIGIGAQDILDANKKLVLAVVWQLVRIHYLQIIGGKQEQEIIDWANASVKDTKITGFSDKALMDGTFLIKLCASIEPRIVNWELVTKGETEEDRQLNAKYAISIAKKLGAIIFLVWDDIVEVNKKMLLIFIASLYDLKMQADN